MQVVRVLVRDMVGDEVHDDPQAERMSPLDQGSEVGCRAEPRPQAEGIGHGVAEIIGRRGGDRRQPDGGRTERGDFIQPGADIDKAGRAEKIRHHTINYRAVDPSRVFSGELDLGRPAVLDSEYRHALIGASKCIGNAQSDVVFAVGKRRLQPQLFALGRLLVQRGAVGSQSKRLRIARAGAPFIVDDRCRHALRQLAPAGIQPDCVGIDAGTYPCLGHVL